MSVTLDKTGKELLINIEKFPGISIADLSSKVYLTPDAVRKRLIKFEDQHLVIHHKKLSKNGVLAHYFSLAKDFDKNIIYQNGQEFHPSSYLSTLSKNQLKILLVLAFINQAMSSSYIAQLAGVKSSSSRTVLEKLLEDTVVKRSERKDNPNFFNYYSSSKVSTKHCIDEIKRRGFHKEWNEIVVSICAELISKNKKLSQEIEKNMPRKSVLSNTQEESNSDVNSSESIKFDDLKTLTNKVDECVLAKETYTKVKNDLDNQISRLKTEYGENFEELYKLLFSSKNV